MQAIASRQIVRSGEGEQVRLMALGVRFLIDGAATGGRFSLVEHPLPPRALGVMATRSAARDASPDPIPALSRARIHCVAARGACDGR